MGQDIPEITDDDLPGLSITRNECFEGESLWGYMNGGADIYHEYGFVSLRVEEFSREDESIKLELFRMDNPVSAFGIYSLKTFKCEESDALLYPYCLNKYQLQMVYGDNYIQIVNESGSEGAQQIMIEVMESIVKKLDDKPLNLPIQYLTDSLGFSLLDIKMIQGELGIQNRASKLTDCFKGIEDFQIYYAKTTLEGEKKTYYEIVFGNPDMKNILVQNANCEVLQVLKENTHSILCK